MHPSKGISGSLSSILNGKRIILCVTGSVAAYLSPAIARELMRHGADVHAFLTPDAVKLLGPQLLHWATGNPVITELSGELEHVKYAVGSDLVLVAPATANTIAKVTHGVADNAVTALLLTAMGYGKNIIIVPAMHEPMWLAEQTRRNVEALRRWGVTVLEPEIVEEKAKLADPAYIVEHVIRMLHPKRLPEGVRVLVSAGATAENIDPIRVVTNQSSGRMGLEIALEAYRRGAETQLILGYSVVEPPRYIPTTRVTDSESLRKTLQTRLTTNPPAIYFSTIAVADYRPRHVWDRKVDTGTTPDLKIELRAVDKILPIVKSISPSTVVVAFKAEYNVDDETLLQRAEKLLEYSDIVYASDVGRPGSEFGSKTTTGIIIDSERKVIHVENLSKHQVAAMLLDLTASKLKQLGM
ncbi:Coenzyme A biosynthesis bifunctional protein CoaBC [archaeon HR01]|nr:Coenzyme A biosynthesis bifunctional protein CoaBC [archaeon HR01]